MGKMQQRALWAIAAFALAAIMSLLAIASTSVQAHAYTRQPYTIGYNIWYRTSSAIADYTRTGFRDQMRKWNVYLTEGKRVCYNDITHDSTGWPNKDNHNYIYKEANSDMSNLATNYCWYSLGVLLESDININSNQPWINGAVAGRYDVQSVMFHEFGHTAGLNHSPYTNAVMYESFGVNTTRLVLTADDIAGAKACAS